MNKRIKELVKQAGGIYHNDDGDELTPALVGKGVEKFAQLIVQECADVALKSGGIPNKSEVAVAESNRIYYKIKEHFGVEE